MSVDTPTAAVAITNLLATYAECIDTGDLDRAAGLFTHAQIKVGVGPAGANPVSYTHLTLPTICSV